MANEEVVKSKSHFKNKNTRTMANDFQTPELEIDPLKFHVDYQQAIHLSVLISEQLERRVRSIRSPTDVSTISTRRQRTNDAETQLHEMIQLQKQKTASTNHSADYQPLFFTPVDCDDARDKKDDDDYHKHPTTNPNNPQQVQPNSDILKPLDVAIQLQVQNKIKFDLLHSTYCWTRVCILFLITILIILSISYTFGGKSSVELDLIQSCDGKNLTEIWDNSDAVDSEGGVDEGCWSTSKTRFDLNTAYYDNRYKCIDRSVDRWSSSQFIVFACFTVFCIFAFIYGVYTLAVDISAIQQHKLYTKSTKFAHFIANNQAKPTKPRSDRTISCFTTDSKAYVALMFGSEIWEIIVQSSALLFYNGYDVMKRSDDTSVALANRPEFVILFACFLSFNCIMTGTLWLLYVFKRSTCNGLIFKLCTFCVDQFCDLLYIFYPFIIIFAQPNTTFVRGDEGASCHVFGLLNINSFAGFVFTLFPILFLCAKSVVMTRSAMRQMHNQSYELWFAITKIMTTTNDKDADYLAKLLGFKINGINKEIYDANGKLNLTVTNNNASPVLNAAQKNKWCRLSIATLGIMLIVYSIAILSFVIHHVTESQSFCDSAVLQEDIPAVHPQFYLYEDCDYKVYPFAFSGDIADQCECRQLRILIEAEDENDALYATELAYIQYVFTNTSALSKVLLEFTMLEKFILEIELEDALNISLELTSAHFRATEMKILHWVGVDVVSFDSSISNWQQLSHFGLKSAPHIESLPSTFAKLVQLQSLIISWAPRLEDSMDLFCDFSQLTMILITNHQVTQIPDCFVHLTQLKKVYVEGCALQAFPLAMLNMTNLQEFSVWSNEISSQSLMGLNNRSTGDHVFEYLATDTATMALYFDANAICGELYFAETHPDFPGLYEYVMNKTSACSHVEQCHGSMGACSPSHVGDGICDTECNIEGCYHDFGDCKQFCFTKTDCTYELFLNAECDAECDNPECDFDSGYCTTGHSPLPKL
eukprot:192874_1